MLGCIDNETTEMIESVGQREYFVTDIARIEVIGAGLLRCYCGVRRGNAIEVRYTVVIPAARVTFLAHAIIEAAHQAGITAPALH